MIASPVAWDLDRFRTTQGRARTGAGKHGGSRPGGVVVSANLAEIALRGVDLITDEVVLDDIRGPFGRSMQYVIRPDFEVHETTVIDPGLIRINIGYGYMRGFDAVSSRVKSSERRKRLAELSATIARLRRSAWELELDFAKALASNPSPRIPPGPLLRVKCEIRQAVGQRVAIAGPDSVPGDSDAWWNDFERHKKDVRFARRATGGKGSHPGAPVVEASREAFGSCNWTFDVRDRRLVVDPVGSGFFAPSTYGQVGDFELLVPQGPHLVHYRRANDEPGAPWEHLGVAFNSAAQPGPRRGVRVSDAIDLDPGDWSDTTDHGHWPEGVSFFQGNYGTPGNLEAVFSVESRPDETQATRGARLFANWFDARRRRWAQPYEIQAVFRTPTGTTLHAITGITLQ